MSDNYLISDAAKQVNVEAHVLRYWEEELGLPIKRNELGHRFYTQSDVERFREIKSMKERGLQLKAIRMILKDGKLDRLGNVNLEEIGVEKDISASENMQENGKENINESKEEDLPAQVSEGMVYEGNREDKAKRLQWLLQQLFRETLQENNQELCEMIKETVLKEMDYQFRVQEEKVEERHTELLKKDEEHFKKIDEMLRKKRRLLRK